MAILSQDNFLSLSFYRVFLFFYHLQRSVTGICHFTPHLLIQHPPHFLFLPQRPILPNYKRSPRSETRYSHSRVWLRSARGPSHTIFYHLLPFNSYLLLLSIFFFFCWFFSSFFFCNPPPAPEDMIFIMRGLLLVQHRFQQEWCDIWCYLPFLAPMK